MPVKLWALAACASASIVWRIRVGPVVGPFGEVQTGDLLRESVQVLFGDVAGVLSALLVVEGLDEVPHLRLLARGECRDLLGFEGFRFPRGGLEGAVFDPQLAELTQLRISEGRAPSVNFWQIGHSRSP